MTFPPFSSYFSSWAASGRFSFVIVCKCVMKCNYSFTDKLPLCIFLYLLFPSRIGYWKNNTSTWKTNSDLSIFTVRELRLGKRVNTQTIISLLLCTSSYGAFIADYTHIYITTYFYLHVAYEGSMQVMWSATREMCVVCKWVTVLKGEGRGICLRIHGLAWLVGTRTVNTGECGYAWGERVYVERCGYARCAALNDFSRVIDRSWSACGLVDLHGKRSWKVHRKPSRH